MGVFDSVRDDDGIEGQVKVWNREMRTYHLGDQVPHREPSTYSVEMQSYDGGGYLNVEGDRFVSWTRGPLFSYLVDKWGSPINTTEVTEVDTQVDYPGTVVEDDDGEY